MIYEVENKFSVKDVAALRARFAAAGAAWSDAETLLDRYFAHPCRDFRQTDEALRLRMQSGQVYVTYKGPKLDAATKTRREMELPVGQGEVGLKQFSELFQSLGFCPVADVRKRREHAAIPWRGHSITACWDDVDELGTFVELELTADETRLDEARQAILSCARSLGLPDPLRRSYLGMLLAVREEKAKA